MNILNQSKILFVVFFGITAMNTQVFPSDTLLPNRTFAHAVKVCITTMVLAATSTLAISSVDIDLDENSKANLLTQVKNENVARGYWPKEVSVRLERFYVTEGRNNQPKYCTRVVGSYPGFIEVELDPGDIFRLPAQLGKGTEGCFFSETELETLGIILPEKFRGLRDLQELNKTGKIGR